MNRYTGGDYCPDPECSKYYGNPSSTSVETETQEQFAIRFAEWVVDNHWTKFGKGNWYIQNYIGQTFYKTTSELMEIFKQQPK